LPIQRAAQETVLARADDAIEGKCHPSQPAVKPAIRDLLKVVRDVIRMIERSEYKRQQAAPGLKITPKAFGLGRRFPIAQKAEV